METQAVGTVRETMAMVARPLRLGLGALWAAGFLGAGLWIVSGVPQLAGRPQPLPPALLGGLTVLAMAGAQFIFLVLVADELCPRAPIRVKIVCKLTAGCVTWAALCWTAWQIFTALNV